MAAYQKFNDYTNQLDRAVHNWATHTFNVCLTNTAPATSNTVFSDIVEIAAGNGYTAGGLALTSGSLTTATGTSKIVFANDILTATGGSIGPFRYAVIYNATATSPLKPLVCWFDYGVSLTLNVTETFTISIDSTNGLWQLT